MMKLRSIALPAAVAAMLGLSGCVAGIERREDRRDDRQDRREDRRDYRGMLQPAIDEAGSRPVAPTA